MSKSEHFERLVRLFKSAPINQSIFKNSRVELSEGVATYHLKVEEEFLHGGNAMHGAIYFKLLDDSAYFAAASLVTDYFLLTKSYQVQFIRPVHLEQVTAKGKVEEIGDHEIIATSEIFNEQGKLVAKGEGVFVRSKKGLSDLEGYL